MNKFTVILSFLFLVPVAASTEPPPLEVYGALPVVSLMTISPSGDRFAFRQVDEDQDVVVVVDTESMNVLAGVGVQKVKPRSLHFLDNNFLVLVASTTVNPFGSVKQFEESAAWLMNISTGKLRQLFRRDRHLYPLQSGLGRIVGWDDAGKNILMPAFTGSTYKTTKYSLYKLGAEYTTQRIVERGNSATVDWFVDASGKSLVREDLDHTENDHTIWFVGHSKDQLLYQEETTRQGIALIGLLSDRSALLVSTRGDTSDVFSYYLMSLEDGQMSGPVLNARGKDVRRVFRDVSRVVHGIEFDGFSPSYEFLDEKMTARMSEIQLALPGMTARLVSWSDDFDDLIVHVGGSEISSVYLLFSKGSLAPQLLGRERPSISHEDVAPVTIDEYPARDGLIIPALITARTDVYDAGNSPLIVLPHGGPAAYDRIEFDWLSQYFASRGYMVLQPQFRGSTGFGADFRSAGRGEWGRKMQTDLDDGVRYLVEKGLADPERVCIVGSSYGGYAALAAGSFSPQLYKCYVSINGISDLRQMLIREKRDQKKDHWIVEYWEEWFGAELTDRDQLEKLSPAFHADKFAGPVLLVHSRHDTVVPMDQSKRMHKALRRAGKDVEFVKLKGEDHWLSRADTRIELLQVVAKFIEKNL